MLREHFIVLRFLKDISAKRFCEVGVYKGSLAKLAIPKVEHYVGVDPYKDYEPEGGGIIVNTFRNKKGNDTPFYWNELYEKVSSELGQHNNCTLLRETSKDAASKFPDGYFDVVYIDANHTYEHVKEDIELWYPKVRLNGFLCGHDYNTVGYPGVKKAVDEIFKKVEKALAFKTWKVVKKDHNL